HRQSPGNRKFEPALRLEHNNFWLNSRQDIGNFGDTGITRVRKPLLTRRPHCDLKAAMIDIEPCKYSFIHLRDSFRAAQQANSLPKFWIHGLWLYRPE